jgi:RNA polymerase sigma factor (sigma-70 family)
MTQQSNAGEFTGHESTFWRVLGSLARHGYAVRPSDARDLIHDFYLEAWAGVNERYDPERGAFHSYLGAAFYRFARRRILQLETFKYRLVDFESAVQELTTSKTPPEILQDREDLRAVHSAVGALNPFERKVIGAFLSGVESSERELATRFAVSRYALREALTDAVGKVAVTLGKAGALSTTEDRVAALLWKEGQSPRKVANLLDLSVAEVQSARNHFVAALISSIRGSDIQYASEKSIMKTQEALGLLKSALISRKDSAALEALRKQAPAIHEALGTMDLTLSDEEWSSIASQPEWLSAVYGALAGEDHEERQASELTRAIEALRRDEQREIGEAFELLVRNLPEPFRNWSAWFKDSQPVSSKYREELEARASVKTAPNASAGLVQYGLTPDSIYAATRGLGLLFKRKERIAEAGGAADTATEKTFPLPVYVFNAANRSVQVHSALIFAEIASTPDLPEGAERPLTNWIFSALNLKPYLIPGYAANVDRERFAFLSTGAQIVDPHGRDDLLARWSRHEPEEERYA